MGDVGSYEKGEIESDPLQFVSIIECINAKGYALKPFIMLRDRIPQLSERAPSSLKVDTIPCSWITDGLKQNG